MIEAERVKSIERGRELWANHINDFVVWFGDDVFNRTRNRHLRFITVGIKQHKAVSNMCAGAAEKSIIILMPCTESHLAF